MINLNLPVRIQFMGLELQEVGKFRRNLEKYSAADLRRYLTELSEVEKIPLYNPHLTVTEQIGWIMVRLGEIEESSRPTGKEYYEAIFKIFRPPRGTNRYLSQS